MPGIIHSLLDTDLYKFTMMQAVLHQFPGAQVEYKFKCRSPGVQLAPYIDEIRDEIRQLCELHFTDEELAYMRGMRFIKSDFVDFLGLFKLNQKYIHLTALPNGEIDIRVRGPWLHTIMFEIPVLAIVSEVFFRNTQPGLDKAEGRRRLQCKIELLKTPGLHELKIADYGTRRRFSLDWQREVLQTLQSALGTEADGQITGTSNVLFAMELGMRPMGTMAHEYLQACQALGPRLRDSQVFGFEKWAQEYRGDLGIALSDVYGMNAFLRDFDMYFCKLFDGARHDSGDPFQWGERMIAHYQANRVDPRTKVIIFSDGLTIPRCIELHERFRGRIQTAFGVGTNLTNDLGPDALQLVLKMIECNGQPVAKISDTPGKTMVEDEGYLAYLRQVFDLPAPPSAMPINRPAPLMR
ncbi:nicotinate phosphoribosyltransferase [Ottowia testudinis]|uniref:Nicotinate phosphoribosyltransferase n=1 Tax=Ottowia testudinis TaxID=2816950 RepID=A0A975CL63_9BURK|nr:nicotinate phosphoribosyltransferase [Ottowia testudinis]QTD47032.1 nicotinate phosphoribosyltransferase [Ottowia testudinis]